MGAKLSKFFRRKKSTRIAPERSPGCQMGEADTSERAPPTSITVGGYEYQCGDSPAQHGAMQCWSGEGKHRRQPSLAQRACKHDVYQSTPYVPEILDRTAELQGSRSSLQSGSASKKDSLKRLEMQTDEKDKIVNRQWKGVQSAKHNTESDNNEVKSVEDPEESQHTIVTIEEDEAVGGTAEGSQGGWTRLRTASTAVTSDWDESLTLPERASELQWNTLPVTDVSAAGETETRRVSRVGEQADTVDHAQNRRQNKLQRSSTPKVHPLKMYERYKRSENSKDATVVDMDTPANIATPLQHIVAEPQSVTLHSPTNINKPDKATDNMNSIKLVRVSSEHAQERNVGHTVGAKDRTKDTRLASPNKTHTTEHHPHHHHHHHREDKSNQNTQAPTKRKSQTLSLKQESNEEPFVLDRYLPLEELLRKEQWKLESAAEKKLRMAPAQPSPDAGLEQHRDSPDTPAATDVNKGPIEKGILGKYNFFSPSPRERHTGDRVQKHKRSLSSDNINLLYPPSEAAYPNIKKQAQEFKWPNSEIKHQENMRMADARSRHVHFAPARTPDAQNREEDKKEAETDETEKEQNKKSKEDEKNKQQGNRLSRTTSEGNN